MNPIKSFLRWLIRYALTEKASPSTIWLGWADASLGGRLIKNLGAPVEPNDAVRFPVRRIDLEYPTVDVLLVYLLCINKIQVNTEILMTVYSFADRGIQSAVGWTTVIFSPQQARFIDIYNYYWNQIYQPATTSDHRLLKYVTGVSTLLGYEAVDLATEGYTLFKLRCIGTTIESYRVDMVTPKISVTDVDIASGRFRAFMEFPVGATNYGCNPFTAFLTASSSTSPKTIAYFEASIIGKGTEEDPYRPQMPEKIIEDPKLGKRNLLALSYSSLIPIDRATGKPLHGTCLIRIFEQPDRDSALQDIPSSITALKAMTGVRELTLDDAKLLAERLDDRLRDGEIEYMFNPTLANELWSLSDFYEREVIDLKRIDPTKIPDFDMLMDEYAKRSGEIGRTDLADKFRALKRR